VTASAPDAPWIERPEVTVQVGQLYASREPCVITTVVGSCIAVGLWDPQARVGGLTQFMVPPLDDAEEVVRFGTQAIDLLVCAMMKEGADRLRLGATVVGAARLLTIDEGDASVAQRTLRFIRDFIRRDGFALRWEDTGGDAPRRLSFETDTGKAIVRPVESTRFLAELFRADRTPVAPAPSSGDVTLF
jgi:chemotaxis protein CheD